MKRRMKKRSHCCLQQDQYRELKNWNRKRRAANWKFLICYYRKEFRKKRRKFEREIKNESQMVPKGKRAGQFKVSSSPFLIDIALLATKYSGIFLKIRIGLHFTFRLTPSFHIKYFKNENHKTAGEKYSISPSKAWCPIVNSSVKIKET